MSNSNWTIGQVEIYQIVELEAGEVIQEIIPNATPENIGATNWLYPHFVDQAGNLKALVQSFLVMSEGMNILIDTCNGNDKLRTEFPQWGNLKIDFLKRLRGIGITEEEVDIVVCTHIHMDHVGWNTRLLEGKWVPTFPNAKYLFVGDEYKYWVETPDKLVDDVETFKDSVDPIVDAGLADFVDVDQRINRHISLIPTPGHTPAHVGVVIESQDQRAIITGDFLHHPCQVANPQWPTTADTSPQDAIRTRINIINEIADTGTLLIGSHFPYPTAGHVVRVENNFVLEV
jgi:glyoxylase-like metal-dependent hydrolase (beta-lactamase superfamily II)